MPSAIFGLVAKDTRMLKQENTCSVLQEDYQEPILEVLLSTVIKIDKDKKVVKCYPNHSQTKIPKTEKIKNALIIQNSRVFSTTWKRKRTRTKI